MSCGENINVNIRKAEKNDMVQVFEMIKELADFKNLRDQVKIDHTVLEDDGFGQKSPCFGCIVAETNGSLAGYALFYYSYSIWNGKFLVLEDLYVKADYRRHGIGKKLFQAVLKSAQDSGIKEVEFHVLSGNPAVNFYKN